MGRPNDLKLSDVRYLGDGSGNLTQLGELFRDFDKRISDTLSYSHKHLNKDNIVYELGQVFAIVKPRKYHLLLRLRISLSNIVDSERWCKSLAYRAGSIGNYIQADLRHREQFDYALDLFEQTLEYNRRYGS